MPAGARWAGAGALLAVAALAGCGTSTASPVAAPPTTATTLPSGPTVPAFGAPASVLPATAADATANASGACSRFATLYVELAQAPVDGASAGQAASQAAAYAAAAAAGAPTQWGQLHQDLVALSDATATPAWSTSPHQLALPQVAAVYADCRPLQ